MSLTDRIRTDLADYAEHVEEYTALGDDAGVKEYEEYEDALLSVVHPFAHYLRNLLPALSRLADVLPEMDTPGPWDAMTCIEADAFADLAHQLCGYQVAERIVELHSLGDDEGDEHYAVRQWLMSEQEGRSFTPPIAPPRDDDSIADRADGARDRDREEGR
jgi:hypothetical protein